MDDIAVPSPVLLAKQISIPESDEVDSDHEIKEETTPDKETPEEPPSSTITTPPTELEEEDQQKDTVVATTIIPTTSSDSEEDQPSLQQRRESYNGPVKRPSIENHDFQKFFMRKVVRDSSEVLMYVLWCGLCLPGTVPHQVEGGVVISNECVYLLEVKGHQNWEWDDDKFPLSPLASMKLEHLSRVTVTGLFNHNLYIEVHQGLPLTSFVVFSSKSEQCHQMIVQLQAALDSSNLDYKIMDALEVKKMKKTSGIIFISPDHYSGNRLKEWLSRERTNVRLANFVSTQMDKKAVGMYEVELQQSCKELARSFDIEQYLVVTSVDSSEGYRLHTLVLVVTNMELFLYEEAFISGPGLRFTPVKYSFPPLTVVHQQKISSIKNITFCNTRQFVHSPSDPMYQVAIEFSQHVGVPWHFCARDFASLTQTLKYIEQQRKTLLSNNDPIISETPSPLPHFAGISDPPSRSPKPEYSHKSGVPWLVKSKPLLHFDSLPYWEKNVKFNEHISQANYLKHDETVVTSSLVNCVPSKERKHEVAVYMIVSNYAIYLISDVDGIREWLDAGGISSFSRMSLLNPDTEYPLQCFYRMWLSDLRKIEVNHLSLSISLHEIRPKVSVDIVTCNAQVTASFITALVGKINIVDDKQEKGEHILQDFVDIADDPFGDEDVDSVETAPPSPSSVRPSVGFSVVDRALTKLKLHLVESQPDVARGSSIHKCSESMQIICSQIMLLAEQVRVRESLLIHYRPHLVLVTNYGLFVCCHATLPSNTPCLILDKPTNLTVKRWSRINDVLSVQMSSDPVHRVPQIFIAVKQSSRSADTPPHTQLCLYPFSHTQGYIFVNQLKLIWAERTGHALQTDYTL